jgi:3'-5' exoribonuclease
MDVKRVWVKDLRPGMTVTDTFMIQEVAEAKTQGGKGDPYVMVTIADKTGSFKIKQWKTTVAEFAAKQGDIVDIHFDVDEYKGRPGGTIRDVFPNHAADRGDFVKVSQYDPVHMWQKMRVIIDTFQDHHFKAVANGMFDDESTEAFVHAPAATSMHHDFVHGLLEHTTQMLECGSILLQLKFFEPLNRDLCMFGLMFHDFGKIYEYSTDPGFPKKLQGRLVPHIPMCAAKIYEVANRHAVPEIVRDHMMHVVLAHHRFLAWGSPVKFACPEAAFVHYVDNLHGDVFGMLQKMEGATTETVSHGVYDDKVTLIAEPFNSTMAKLKGVTGGF